MRNVKTSNTFTKHAYQGGSTFTLLKEGRFGESLWEGQREGGANSFISPNVNEVSTTNGGLLGYERDGRSGGCSSAKCFREGRQKIRVLTAVMSFL